MVSGLPKRHDEMEKGLEKARRGWFNRVALLFSGPKLDEAVWYKAEEMLISADVGVTTTVDLIQRVRQRAQKEGLFKANQVLEVLKEEMVELLQPRKEVPSWDLRDTSVAKPWVILVVGVNGVGKTTSIAKLAYYLGKVGKRVILGAADTFRAAAQEQLQAWGQRLAIDVVAHHYGSDPGAVAYDAYQAALGRKADILIVDTAGRLHTKHNLMEELKKVSRVLNRLDSGAPHQVLLVMDATTGHNGVFQARQFTDAVGCHGLFLAKLDGTAKGGIVVEVARELNLPVLFIGTGEELEDMAPFDPKDFVEALFTPVEQLESPRE